MRDELSGTLIRLMAEQERKQVIIDCCSGMAPGWVAAIKEMADSVTEALPDDEKAL